MAINWPGADRQEETQTDNGPRGQGTGIKMRGKNQQIKKEGEKSFLASSLLLPFLYLFFVTKRVWLAC